MPEITGRAWIDGDGASTCWTPRTRFPAEVCSVVGKNAPLKRGAADAPVGCESIWPPRDDDEVQALVEQLSADLDRSVLVDDASRSAAARTAPRSDPRTRSARPRSSTRETPRVIRDLHFAQGIASATPPRAHGAARPDVGLESPRVRADPLPGRAVRLPVADRRRPVADRRRLRGGRSDGSRDRHRRGTAATNSRSRQRAAEVRLLELLLGDDPAQRETPPGAKLAARRAPGRRDARIAGAPPCAPGTSRRPSWGVEERPPGARAGPVPPHAAAPPRRSARVQADHGVLVVALDGRARHRRTNSPARPRTRSTRPSPSDGPRDHVGYSDLGEHLRDAHRAHEHARLALRSRRRCRSMAHLLVGRLSAPTGCWPRGRGRRTPSELIHPGLPKLFALQTKESLVQTLEAYLDNGCDTKLTAEALFLHRASLYYRLAAHRGRSPRRARSRAGRTSLAPALRTRSWRAWWACIQR